MDEELGNSKKFGEGRANAEIDECARALGHRPGARAHVEGEALIYASR